MQSNDSDQRPATWLARSRRDPVATERAFAALPFAQRLALIASARTGAALDLLLLAEDPAPLIAATRSWRRSIRR